ncbi:hypothetical protein PR048_022146 [Dryococelus australis]|uniref:Uncharacterized protein n=1 Tax=Dryococelus australis TaxID=614101 RepID=A0ABQ9H090_9NEOP|nr:hypothetical protein PR048_022146 [Dryococelus australis]
MFARPMVAQEWSVHAQLTISHQQPPGTAPLPTASSTGVTSNGDRVQMECSWRSQPGTTTTTTTNTTTTASRPCYGFQRGNILFTTRPPTKDAQPVTTNQPKPSRDSGYSSSQFSYNSLPTRKPSQPYNRRCKSTCSIVLNQATNHRCSDPVCYHSAPSTAAFSSVPEGCEVCGGGRSPTAARRASRLNTFTSHFCTRVPEKAVTEKLSKDVASQTLEGLPQLEEKSATSEQQKQVRRTPYNTRSKTDSQLLDIPGSSGSKPKVSKRVTRSPAKLRGKSPVLLGRRSQGSQCSDHENKQKPRTVHIDVYCTGSEDADASSSSDSDTAEEGDSLSSPQTVYESEKFKVVHTRAGKNQLPQSYVGQQNNKKEGSAPHRKSESFKCESVKESPIPRGYESDDILSSAYPSKQSSCTWLNDNFSILSDTTGDLSTAMSSSSCALSGDGYESVTATSWKDTGTDVDSVVHSTVSIAQSDSFDYADSIDRLRIRAKEKAWEESKCWRSPQQERRHLLQQEKLKEYVEKNKDIMPFPLWKPDSTEDSEDDDETGDAWSIGGWDCTQKHGSLKREDTVKMVNKDKYSPAAAADSSLKDQKQNEVSEKLAIIPSHVVPILKVPVSDVGSLSDSSPSLYKHVRRSIGPFGSRSPSPPPAKVESSVTSPFTVFGKTTNQLLKAQKFGTIVGAFRKPGHHVGPSKNPDCHCEHCRRFYEETGHRSRTRSVGDMPHDSPATWRANSVPASILVDQRVPADFDTQ